MLCYSVVCLHLCSSRKLLAWRLPFINVKIFSSNQPIHSALLWPWRNKFKLFTDAIFILAASIKLFTKVLIFMVFQRVSTKTFWMWSKPWALWLFLFVPICYLYINICLHKFCFILIPLHGRIRNQSFFWHQLQGRT